MVRIDENEFHFKKTQEIDIKKFKASDVRSVAKEEFQMFLDKVADEKLLFD